MTLFSGKNNILGIDLGSTSIKVVELKRGGSMPSLVTYGYLEKAAGDIERGHLEELQEKLVGSLNKLCQRAGVTTDLAVTAIPNFSVFSSIINLPVLPNKELKEAIINQAKKIIPLPYEEIVLDWKILEKTKIKNEKNIQSKAENYRILINVVVKKLVKRYMEIFKKAGLQLTSLETESFALARSLVGNDLSTVMIIDFSAVSTDVIIIEKCAPVFNRSIDIGGLTLTRALAENLKIDFKRAEQFKRDLATSDGDGVPNVIKNTIQSVVSEIKYSLDLFQSQNNKKIEKIILSGGSAYLSKLSNYFSKELDMKVFVSNPWKRIAYPRELEPALLEVAPRFSVAIGLALK